MSTSTAETSSDALTEREVAILAFERQWWKYAGMKEKAIREQFDLTPAAFYQVLNQLIDRPEALEHDPLLIRRLTRLRAHRQLERASRRLGFDV